MYTTRFYRHSQISFCAPMRIVCLVALLAVAIAAVGGCNPPPSRIPTPKEQPRITKGPFLLRLSEHRAAIMWETNSEGPCTVLYGLDEKLGQQINTKSDRVEYGLPWNRKTVYIHKVWLENLQTGQVYYYRVMVPETESMLCTFKTPGTDVDEVRFAVYGDCRSNPQVHRKVVERIIEKDVDFVVIAGDLVTDGGNYEQWGVQFFGPLKDLAESTPVYAIKGNHDKSNQNYFERLLVPPGKTANFAFDYGPVHFFCADNYSGTETQILALIGADMGGNNSPWKFVSYHVPSLNFGGHRSKWGYPNALPSLSKAGVDFAIAGHSHQYERFRPVAPPSDADGSYVTYITSGGGGAGLYSVKRSVYHAYAGKIHHFCLFDIKRDKLTMKAIDANGEVIDQISVHKAGGRLNNEYLQTAVPMEAVRAFQD